MSQSWVKCCSNRQMNKLGHFGPSDPLSGKQEFHQKIWLHQFWVFMVTHLHAKYIKKMSQSWEKCCSNRQMDKLSHFEYFCPNFGQIRCFPKKLVFTIFEYLWSQNLIKNIRKNYWPNYARNAVMYGCNDVRTDGQTQIHITRLSQSVDPITQISETRVYLVIASQFHY